MYLEQIKMTQLDDLKKELRQIEKQIDLMVAWCPRSIALNDLRERRYRIIDTLNNIQ